MAGMFYSLQEVAEKLNKTEEEAKQIIKNSGLREFRDGPNLLFRVDEVEALLSDTSITASKDDSAETEQETDQETDQQKISPPPEPTEVPAETDELTEADTIITGEGINVLGETDSDYQLADDTMGETKAAPDETPLEKIEEDINLDTFGSGSGLLDLSLQADDTSLGGVLDEIYTPEGGDEAQDAGGSGSAMEVAAEAEQMLPEEELAGPQLAPEVPAMARAYIEPEPDVLSNTYGMLLFLPLLALIYTAIVAVAAQRAVMPAILERIQGTIWYIMIGAIVATALTIGAAFMLAGKSAKAGRKQKIPPKKSQ